MEGFPWLSPRVRALKRAFYLQYLPIYRDDTRRVPRGEVLGWEPGEHVLWWYQQTRFSQKNFNDLINTCTKVDFWWNLWVMRAGESRRVNYCVYFRNNSRRVSRWWNRWERVGSSFTYNICLFRNDTRRVPRGKIAGWKQEHLLLMCIFGNDTRRVSRGENHWVRALDP